MKQESIDASNDISKLASENEYRSLIAEFYTNQRKGWIIHMRKRGVDINDAEDIFSSVIEYLLQPKSYSKYLSSNIKYDSAKEGLAKIAGFATFIFKIFRTKISNYFRSCKRSIEAMTKYAQTLCDDAFNPEKIVEKAEEKSSAFKDNYIVFTNTNFKINQTNNAGVTRHSNVAA